MAGGQVSLAQYCLSDQAWADVLCLPFLSYRFDFIKRELSSFLKKGLFNLKDVTFIPVSAYTGANIKEPVSKELAPWCKSVRTSLLPFSSRL